MAAPNLNFRTKLLIAGIILTGGPLLGFGAAVWWQNTYFRQAAESDDTRLAESVLDQVAQSVYVLCDTARAALERTVSDNLHAATVLLEEAGNFNQQSGSLVTWASLKTSSPRSVRPFPCPRP